MVYSILPKAKSLWSVLLYILSGYMDDLLRKMPTEKRFSRRKCLISQCGRLGYAATMVFFGLGARILRRALKREKSSSCDISSRMIRRAE